MQLLKKILMSIEAYLFNAVVMRRSERFFHDAIDPFPFVCYLLRHKTRYKVQSIANPAEKNPLAIVGYVSGPPG